MKFPDWENVFPLLYYSTALNILSHWCAKQPHTRNAIVTHIHHHFFLEKNSYDQKCFIGHWLLLNLNNIKCNSYIKKYLLNKISLTILHLWLIFNTFRTLFLQLLKKKDLLNQRIIFNVPHTLKVKIIKFIVQWKIAWTGSTINTGSNPNMDTY